MVTEVIKQVLQKIPSNTLKNLVYASLNHITVMECTFLSDVL